MKQTNQAAPKFAPKVKPKVDPRTTTPPQQLPNQKPQPPKAQVQAQKPEFQETMPLGKMNYIMIGISLLLIVIGFFLMSGSSNEGSTFNNDVFSSTRIVVAPFITFLGFLCMVPAILWHGKKTQKIEQ